MLWGVRLPQCQRWAQPQCISVLPICRTPLQCFMSCKECTKWVVLASSAPFLQPLRAVGTAYQILNAIRSQVLPQEWLRALLNKLPALAVTGKVTGKADVFVPFKRGVNLTGNTILGSQLHAFRYKLLCWILQPSAWQAAKNRTPKILQQGWPHGHWPHTTKAQEHSSLPPQASQHKWPASFS